jgi:hypothetical protein
VVVFASLTGLGGIPLLARGDTVSMLFGGLAVLSAIGTAIAPWREGLVTDHDGVRVRKLFWTTGVRWDQVSAFTIKHDRKRQTCRIALTDGSSRYAFALRREDTSDSGLSETTVAELNQLLLERRRVPLPIATVL